MKSENFKKNRQLVSRFLPYMKKYRGMLVADLVCASLSTVCDLALPLFVRRITDTAVSDISLLTWKLILSICGAYLVLCGIGCAADYYTNVRGHLMGTKIENDMRNDLFSHLQELSFSYYDNTKIGQLMSRLTSDLLDITEVAHHLPESLFITTVQIIVCFIIFATMNIWLALIIFAVAPLMFIATKKSRRKMKETFKETRHQVGELNAQAEDSLLGIRVVKSFANEEVEKHKFTRGSEEYLRIKQNSHRYLGRFFRTVTLLDGFIYIFVVGTGAVFMMKGKTTPGDFSASLLLINTMIASIRSLVNFSEQFNRGITGIERFTEVMDELSESTDSPDAKEITDVRGELEFRDVCFTYPGTEKAVLKNIDIKINSGENIAIVGPSGSGKTTLCNLIPRFYPVNSGEILLDGVNINNILLKSLRSNIGVVQQDVYMFSGTVRENIAYGKPDADISEIIDAAKSAGAHEFITELPDGYDTYVGERGVKLSGGQKQRISIARLFLKNPPILILDEATSSLDNESERLVQGSLEKLAHGRTTITIAHRLTTIRNAKKILVLTKDGIVERGSHKELIAKGGVYSDLYNLYATI
ncbi:MAG: ABC transporter ATP-binding protein/permease [Clostridiales bacterium]|nr:ABC transporter ATP-binding protein/permease [Clostridiales bacterium]